MYGDQLTETKQRPDFVVVGHVCQDLLPDGGLSLGGSVSYAATTALRMGCNVGVVTSTGPDLDLAQALPGAQIACHESAATTLFENIYLDGKRKQIIHQRADTIRCEFIPFSWRSAPMVYLGAIDQEIDPEVFCCFADESLIAVMPQGFFRQWDDQGRVSFVEWNPPQAVLERINVLVLSELDVVDPEQLVRDWEHLIEIIVVTHAERGATVYQAGELCHYPARPAQEVDPTGAGDVFTAAFLVYLSETNDHCQAAGFANAVASFSVEGTGVTGIPLRRKVKAYMSEQMPGPPDKQGP
jgi:sugar/nucleoside kinase (ribokinase family)